MATISTAGVVDGQIIYAVHVERIVYALDGTASNNIIINADLKQGSLTNTTNLNNSHAQGEGTDATGDFSHSEGKDTTASGDYSHSEGQDTVASGSYSHTEGEQTSATGKAAHAEGYYTIARGDYSHAGGHYTIAHSNYQTVVGQFNIDNNSSDYFVIGDGTANFPISRSNALGVNASRTYISNSLLLPDLITSSTATSVLTYDITSKQVYYTASSALGGGGTPAPPDKAIQFNSGSTFSGSANFLYVYSSHSLQQGANVIASGLYSHAQGSSSRATGSYSHAEGLETRANGNYSHAEGYQTTSSGQYSHAKGQGSVARGDGAFASGWYTIAHSNFQTALGQFNIDNNTTDYLVIGVGTNVGNRKNGFGINDTRTYISNSLYLPDLDNTAQTFVLTYDTVSKKVHYRTGSAFGGGGSGTPGGSDKQIQFNSASVFSGSANYTFDYVTNRVSLTGSMLVTGSVTASKAIISSSGNEQLKIIGSGSSAPILGIYGSQGNLFTINDSLSGSLLSVNDISAIPVFEVFSDKTVLLGSNTAPSYHTSDVKFPAASTAFTLGLVPTSSYDGMFYEYVAKSGSNSRSGYITANWAGTSIVSASLITADIGSTTGLVLYTALSGSYVVLSGSANTANWKIKSIIRAI